MSKDHSWVIVFGCLCLSGLSACAAEDEPAAPAEAQVWVGEVTDTDALVGVAMLEEKVALFVCGGPSTLSNLTVWMTGAEPVTRESPLRDEQFSVGFDRGEAGLLGDVERGDVSHSFAAVPTKAGTLAGLYSADSDELDGARLGLIVRQEAADEPPTGQGALIRGFGPARIFEQVNPVFPERAGDPIFVTLPSDPTQLIRVQRVVPGL